MTASLATIPAAAEPLPVRCSNTKVDAPEAKPVVTALDTAISGLQKTILDELEPGMLLPAEADLAAQYGVSRLTIREALKVLTGRGLVKSRRGRRPEVCEPDSSILSAHLRMASRREPRALLELIEIRESLEVLVSGLAASNSTRAAVSGVSAALDRMRAAATTLDAGPADELTVTEYNQADIAFHEGLALASGNRMLAFLLEGFEGPLQHSFAHSFEGHVRRGTRVADVVTAHDKVLGYVRAADAANARKAMRALLRSTARDLRYSLLDDLRPTTG